MPLRSEQTNWAARIAVVLLCALIVGAAFPIAALLHSLHAPDIVVDPLIGLWVILVLLSLLWVLAVWLPVRGRKFAESALKIPWNIG